MSGKYRINPVKIYPISCKAPQTVDVKCVAISIQWQIYILKLCFLYSQVLLIGQSTNIIHIKKSKPSLRSTDWSLKFKAELCNIPIFLLIPDSILIYITSSICSGYGSCTQLQRKISHLRDTMLNKSTYNSLLLQEKIMGCTSNFHSLVTSAHSTDVDCGASFLILIFIHIL